MFIFKFYRFLARKDVFKLDLKRYNKTSFAFLKKIISVIFYLIEYILLFPIFVFFWFIIMVVLFSFLAKSQPVNNILLVSIAVVGAVRFTAYYHEDLSKDLAKMLPFALLGVFLIDISYFKFSESLTVIQQIPSQWHVMLYYLLFIILLEFVLRISYTIVKDSMTLPSFSSISLSFLFEEL
ncbi:MAG: hypothetical protein Q8O03_01250 [Nanoarchaeota archaeon]|nr:hypothetical protein [Nanoarchaeota archaeon]